MRTSQIVVGIAGADADRPAVLWAAREATRRRLPLRVVHAFEGHPTGTDRQLAEVVTEAAAEQARDVAPTVGTTAVTVAGSPAAKLLESADGAELIVLGTRGRGPVTGLVLGSVSQRVTAHAPCPVVIVRGRADASDGPVVVGVDDSPEAGQVLEAAFEAAASRGCALAAIRTFLAPTPLWIGDVAAMSGNVGSQDTAERAAVDELLAPWRAKYPAVTVEVTVSHDKPGTELARASHGAQLVVVGSHGHGAVSNAFAGSTGTQLLQHADCPVLIVRPGPGEGDRR